MTKLKKSSIITIIIVFLCCLVITVNYKLSFNDSDNKSVNKPAIISHTSGTLAYKSMDDLFIESTLVIKGTAQSGTSFKISPTFGGDPQIFTDYIIDIDEIYRSDGEKLSNVTVRVMGGTVDDEELIADQEPRLFEGKTFLLFLKQPGVGAGYNTKGDYYYVCGAIQGTFDMDTENIFTSQSGDGQTLELTDFSEKIKQYNEKYPVDKELYKNTFIENLKRNLESEFITKEEYDLYYKEIFEYATIVKN